MNIFSRILLSSSLLIAASACSDSDTDGVGMEMYQDIVTLSQLGSNSSTFDFQVVDDSPLVTLTADVRLNPEKFPVGARLFITYTSPSTTYGQNAHISLYAVSRIYEASLIADGSSHVPEWWDNEPVAVTTLYRSGSYINLIAQIDNSENRSFYIAPDAATLSSSQPEIYIYTKSTAGDAAIYKRRTVASFSIADIWSRPDVTAVTVHIANSENPYKTSFKFNKK